MLMLRKDLTDGVLAGMMVSFGGAVLLSCDNRYAGAFLFCIALLAICFFGFNLYTGKVGFLIEDHGKAMFRKVFSGLAGNFLGTLLFGLVVGAAVPALRESAAKACAARLTQLPIQTLLRGLLCGILMYVAVWIYGRKKSVLGILFCIPVFVLSGFEHSIADMFYFSLAGAMFRPQSLLFLLLVVLGNSAGGLFIPLLGLVKGKDSDG